MRQRPGRARCARAIGGIPAPPLTVASDLAIIVPAHHAQRAIPRRARGQLRPRRQGGTHRPAIRDAQTACCSPWRCSWRRRRPRASVARSGTARPGRSPATTPTPAAPATAGSRSSSTTGEPANRSAAFSTSPTTGGATRLATFGALPRRLAAWGSSSAAPPMGTKVQAAEGGFVTGCTSTHDAPKSARGFGCCPRR